MTYLVVTVLAAAAVIALAWALATDRANRSPWPHMTDRHQMCPGRSSRKKRR